MVADGWGMLKRIVMSILAMKVEGDSTGTGCEHLRHGGSHLVIPTHAGQREETWGEAGMVEVGGMEG